MGKIGREEGRGKFCARAPKREEGDNGWEGR